MSEGASKSAELAKAVLTACEARQLTLGSAESCTGGLIAAAITEIAGSSTCFMGSIVSYWVDIKQSVLGVDEEIIEKYGVVSEQCAAAMAQGCRRVIGCDYAVSTTGIAGPTGAEPGKPVGTVCYAIASPQGVRTFTTCRGSSRSEVRAYAVEHVLEELLKDVSR